MGGALALSLSAKGHRVNALFARRLRNARRIANLIGAEALPASQIVSLPASDLIIIATPDDAIAQVADKLAFAQTGQPGTRVALHTSGALSSAVLSPLADKEFKTGSLHPLVSVSDAVSGAAKLRGAYFCLEGARAALQVGRRIVSDLGGHAFSIEPRYKVLYHAAAVMASGNMTALFDIAIEMLAACGLSRRHAREVLLPLVQSAVANLSLMEPSQALTGTFARGDVATVQKHLAAIREQSLPDVVAAYSLLGQRSVSLARRRRLTPAIADQISILLKQSRKGRQ